MQKRERGRETEGERECEPERIWKGWLRANIKGMPIISLKKNN
jgi:hypothetical protein